MTGNSTLSGYMAFRDRATHAAQYMHNTYGLPVNHLAIRRDSIQIFTADLDDLAFWLDITGGQITVQPAGPGTVLRTLHTATDRDGDRPGIPVQVLVLAPADADVMPEIAAATLRPTAA